MSVLVTGPKPEDLTDVKSYVGAWVPEISRTRFHSRLDDQGRLDGLGRLDRHGHLDGRGRLYGVWPRPSSGRPDGCGRPDGRGHPDGRGRPDGRGCDPLDHRDRDRLDGCGSAVWTAAGETV